MKTHHNVTQGLTEIKFRMLPGLRHSHNDFLLFLNFRNNKPFHACLCIRIRCIILFNCIKALPVCSYAVNYIANLRFYCKC